MLSNRPLHSNEVFQVRIDKMVDKWAGSIEIGVTTHNPAYLQLPSTMTNLRSGTLYTLKQGFTLLRYLEYCDIYLCRNDPKHQIARVCFFLITASLSQGRG